MTDAQHRVAKRQNCLTTYSAEKYKRVPIEFFLSGEVYIENAGLPIGKTLWTLTTEQSMEQMLTIGLFGCSSKGFGTHAAVFTDYGSIANVMSEPDLCSTLKSPR
jgi:hypothetical protein